MEIRSSLRKLLYKLGLLHPLRSVKKQFVSTENTFRPGDPRTLFSTLEGMKWLQAEGLAEGCDVLEFGIFRGFNLWFAQALARNSGIKDMRFFGFDSFFGLPPITGIDEGGPFTEGQFSVYKDEVREFYTRYGVDWQRTFLVEGFFDKSLTPETKERLKLRRCGLAIVDCDLYSSTVDVLKFLAPLIEHRTFVYFDDWEDFNGAPEKGEPKAFAEFMAANASTFKAHPYRDLAPLSGKGAAFILERIS